jgi:hypothetical protein
MRSSSTHSTRGGAIAQPRFGGVERGGADDRIHLEGVPCPAIAKATKNVYPRKWSRRTCHAQRAASAASKAQTPMPATTQATTPEDACGVITDAAIAQTPSAATKAATPAVRSVIRRGLMAEPYPWKWVVTRGDCFYLAASR